MANVVYPKGKEAMLTAAVDVISETIYIQMMDDNAIYDATDDIIGDVTGTLLGSPVEITSKDFTSGQFTGSVGSFTPPLGGTVIALIIYINSSGQLLAWLDSKADTAPISIETTGGSILLHWDEPFFSIGGV